MKINYLNLKKQEKKEVESKFFSKGNVPVIYSNHEYHMITTSYLKNIYINLVDITLTEESRFI